jgi:hypothetical protein
MRLVCERIASGAIFGQHGAVAQPGRAPAWHAGSRRVQIPPAPPIFIDMTRVGFTLGGFVAGEGSFVVTSKTNPRHLKNGQPRKRFVFSVHVAQRDRLLLEALRSFLGYGVVYDTPPQRPTWEPTSVFAIGSLKGHREATIPFAESFLLPSAKRSQFEKWRAEMTAYEEMIGNRIGLGPSPCSMPDCEKPVRGRGLCRSHYFQATGS